MSETSKDKTGRVLPFAATKTAAGRCPMCGKPAKREFRPFCSRRCADLDLGHWLGGSYRIPTEEAPRDHDLGDEEDLD